MSTYSITAYCRTLGAIGIKSHHVLTVEADSLEDAQDKAYATHEHFDGSASIFDHTAARSYNFLTLKPHEA